MSNLTKGDSVYMSGLTSGSDIISLQLHTVLESKGLSMPLPSTQMETIRVENYSTQSLRQILADAVIKNLQDMPWIPLKKGETVEIHIRLSR